MQLSVIIVNYNVRHFLEQALLSVRKASEGLAVETWVVDNNSTDDSLKMLRERFPEVKVITNRDNVGFSKANNQAIQASSGTYVLLLNPDTVVGEDTFRKCVAYMDAHADSSGESLAVGGLGVHTIDGSGTFLPESKRGFPSPWVAFCKAFGLSALFPHSAFFNWYYLGHLSEKTTHDCEVLVGSFMLLRRGVLDKIGWLDEDFFMYGEDIDLSYRIVKGGYRNAYFADTSIIHYKGESTKKGSLNYVRVFYGAMIIFAKKHFQGQKAALFILLMQAAVWFRASLTLLSNVLKKIYIPIADALFIAVGLYFLKDFWSNYYFHDPDYIKSDFLYINLPLYTIIWLSTIYFSGGYDKPTSLRRILRGVFVGTILLAAVYGFLDLTLRSSRMLIVLGALWTGISLIALRFLNHFAKNRNFRLGTEGVKNLVFVGHSDECQRARQLLNQSQVAKNIIGNVSPVPTADLENYVGDVSQLGTLVDLFNVEEVIFCAKDVSYQTIIAHMTQLGAAVTFKILPEGSNSIIGSSSKNATGELYTMSIRFNIASPMNRRNKRVVDVVGSVLLLLGYVFLILTGKSGRITCADLGRVLVGQRTFVGYTEGVFSDLPPLKKGIFPPTRQVITLDAHTAHRVNYFYAKDYTVGHDLKLIFRRIWG